MIDDDRFIELNAIGKPINPTNDEKRSFLSNGRDLSMFMFTGEKVILFHFSVWGAHELPDLHRFTTSLFSKTYSLVYLGEARSSFP